MNRSLFIQQISTTERAVLKVITTRIPKADYVAIISIESREGCGQYRQLRSYKCMSLDHAIEAFNRRYLSNEH